MLVATARGSMDLKERALSAASASLGPKASRTMLPPMSASSAKAIQ